jgi:hypothetical protein
MDLFPEALARRAYTIGPKRRRQREARSVAWSELPGTGTTGCCRKIDEKGTPADRITYRVLQREQYLVMHVSVARILRTFPVVEFVRAAGVLLKIKYLNNS